ncbi:uncharacterized protein NEMAJ01_0520 [Nematocida major]|uniref:uncharacterized protein n=1 Tax=Nematocida major TaxID=1912982 RepID=UPI00200803D4|nr:uncharacterized protein NEMAJ01_0520 [Nematocida major]KAH9385624.1 hypothetical protein NEMAJ01_0520 [Nematocida major]
MNISSNPTERMQDASEITEMVPNNLENALSENHTHIDVEPTKASAFYLFKTTIITAGDLIENCGFLFLYMALADGCVYSFLVGLTTQLAINLLTTICIYRSGSASQPRTDTNETEQTVESGAQENEHMPKEESELYTYRGVLSNLPISMKRLFAAITIIKSLLTAGILASILGARIFRILRMDTEQRTMPVDEDPSILFWPIQIGLACVSIIFLTKKTLLRQCSLIIYTAVFLGFFVFMIAYFVYMCHIDIQEVFYGIKSVLINDTNGISLRRIARGFSMTIFSLPFFHGTANFAISSESKLECKKIRVMQITTLIVMTVMYCFIGIIGAALQNPCELMQIEGDMMFGMVEMVHNVLEQVKNHPTTLSLLIIRAMVDFVDAGVALILVGAIIRNMTVVHTSIYQPCKRTLYEIGARFLGSIVKGKHIALLVRILVSLFVWIMSTILGYILMKNSMQYVLEVCGFTIWTMLCVVFPFVAIDFNANPRCGLTFRVANSMGLSFLGSFAAFTSVIMLFSAVMPMLFRAIIEKI